MTRRIRAFAWLWAISIILSFTFPAFAQLKTGGIELRGKMTFFEKASGTWCGGAAVNTSVLCYDTTTDALQVSNNNGSFLNLLLSAGSISIASGKTFTVSNSITLAGTDGKTLTVSNSLALAGTDATVMTFPTTSATVARTDAGNTFTGTNQINGSLRVGSASAPSKSLHVSGAAATIGQIVENTDGSNAFIQTFVNTSTQVNYVIGAGNTGLGFFTGATDFAAASATERMRITSNGLMLPPSALTAGTMTVASSATSRTVWHRFDWTNAMVTALGAVTAGDVAVGTLPAKTVVTNAYVVITSAAGTVTTLTVAVGRTGAGYIDYIVASDAKAAANTVYGDAGAERGTNLTGYDLPSFTATTVVNAHFISTGGNLNTVTASTGSVYIETALLP